MDLKDNRRRVRLRKSFSYALQGILYTIKTEQNMKIHLIISVFVLIGSFYFHITRIEWCIVLLTIGGMLGMEALNTAIERAVDLYTPDFHPLAKAAKDVAAGAALIFSIISVIIGIIIFLPYIR